MPEYTSREVAPGTPTTTTTTTNQPLPNNNNNINSTEPTIKRTTTAATTRRQRGLRHIRLIRGRAARRQRLCLERRRRNLASGLVLQRELD